MITEIISRQVDPSRAAVRQPAPVEVTGSAATRGGGKGSALEPDLCGSEVPSATF